MAVRLTLLGGFQVHSQDREVVELAAQPTRSALLVYLAMEGRVSRDELLGVFWPEQDPQSARHALSQNLHRLRKALGGSWLDTTGERVEVTGEVEVDAILFQERAEKGNLAGALTLYRGHFLSGWYLGQTAGFESWMDRQRARLERLHRKVRREHLQELLEHHRLPEALRIARGWAELDPLEDEAQHAVIALLAELGRRNEALSQFRSYEEVLEREDLTPLPETLELVREIREGGPVLGERVEPLPADLPPAPGAGEKRRRFSSFSLAVLALLILVAAGLFRFPGYMGMNPGRGLTSLGDGHRIVLADFQNATADTLLAVAAAEALRVDLSAGLRGALLEPGEVSSVLRRMGREPGSSLEPEAAREVALRAGAELVISGQVGSVGSSVILSAEIRRAESGEVLAAYRQVAESETEIIDALEGLSRDLLKSLSPFPGPSPDRDPLPEVTTTSLDALRKYSQAVRIWELRADGPAALALLGEAVVADSTFAMAYRKMGTILVTLQLDRDRQIWALERAYQNREHLTDIERLLTAASYHRAITGDEHAAAAALTALLELDPDDPGAMTSLASILDTRGDVSEAEELMRRCTRLEDAPPLCWFRLAEILYAQGQAEEAWEVLNEVGDRFPRNWQVEEMRVYWMTAQGRYGEADSILRVAGRGGDPRLQTARLRARAGLAAVRGRVNDARGYLAEALRILEEAKLANPFCWTGLTDALVLLELRSDTVAALAVADGIAGHSLLAELEPMDRPYLPLAQVYALAGERERTGDLVQEFLSQVPEHARGPFDSSLFQVRGILAAQQGRIREAREAFLAAATRTSRIRTVRYQAFLHERAQDPDSALAAYEEFLEIPDIRRFDFDQLLLGPVLERMAEIEALQGRRDDAARTLDRLADLWWDADPELKARAEEARRRLLSPSIGDLMG